MKPEEIERHFGPGECILEPGCARREAYVIRSGEVSLEPAAGGDAVRLGAGDLFGEVAAILGRPHVDRARAESEVTLLVLDLPLLHRLCCESRELALRLIVRLSERVAALAERAAPAEMPEEDEAFARVAEVLLERCGDLDGPAHVSGKLLDLARHAGVGLRAAYGVIQGLIEERVLRLMDDQLTLLQADLLRTRLREVRR